MARLLLAHPNFADPNPIVTPVYSGGSWVPDLPLTNLSDRRLARVTRSVDTLLTSTQFDIDFQVIRPVRLIALPKHNLTPIATLRIRGSNTAGDFSTPVYDSGWVSVFPSIYPSGSLPWGHPSFWTGTISAEDAAGYNLGFIHIIPTSQAIQYLRIEINDTVNPDGYLDLSRLFVATGYQPSINASYGAQLRWSTSTTGTETDGGATIYDRRPMRRTCTFTLEHIPEDEALVNIFEMQRKLGKDGQLFFVFDPDDTVHLHRRSFLAVFGELSPIDYAYFGRNSIPFSLVEDL